MPPAKSEQKEFPRTIVWISGDGVTGSIAARLQDEGVTVFYSLVDDWSLTGWNPQDDKEALKRMKSRHQGMIKSCPILTLLRALKDIKDKSQYFIVCDTNALYPVAEQLKKMGYEGLLPSEADYKMEEDRAGAKKFVEKNYPIFDKQEAQEFKKTEDVEKYLDENPETFYVGKGNDENVSAVVPNTDIAEHNHAIIKDSFEGDPGYESGGMMLEEQIRDIVEFCAAAYAYDGKVIGVNIDLENKPVGAGNEGFQTGDSSSIICWLSQSYIYEQFLKPMESKMLRKGELTLWDANVAYSPSRNKFYFLEYCSNRFGINALFDEICTQPSVSEYFRKIIEGQPLYDAETKKFGASIRVFNLKHGGALPKDGALILGDDQEGVWLVDAKKEDKKTKVVGYDENVMIITGSGDTLEEAFYKAYETMHGVSYTDGVKRPHHDVMSTAYQSSIPNRFQVMKQLFEELQ